MATQKIRMLADKTLDEIPYRCNDAVEIDARVATQLIQHGLADGNTAAVDYALTLGELKTHPVQTSAQAEPVTLADLVKRALADIVVVLPTLADADIDQLLTLDAADGKPRKGLVDEIEAERKKRAEAAGAQ